MTKTDIKLEDKLKEIYREMPGIEKELKPYSMGSWGMHWSGSVEDAAYLKVGEYKFTAAKWEEHEWSEGSGGIQWTGWISCYYQKDGEPLKTKVQNHIVTRDMHHAYKDKPELWPHHYVKITPSSSNSTYVSWCDADGKEGPGSEVKLDDI
jgi:hypothetical protein